MNTKRRIWTRYSIPRPLLETATAPAEEEAKLKSILQRGLVRLWLTIHAADPLLHCTTLLLLLLLFALALAPYEWRIYLTRTTLSRPTATPPGSKCILVQVLLTTRVH